MNVGSLERYGVAMRDDSGRLFHGLDGSDGRGFNHISLLHGATHDGGFGGGGSDYGANSYGSGGGGYYGGNESVGANSMLNNAYTAYTYLDSGGNMHQTEGDMRHGALSFVHSSGSNVTDNGLYGSSSSFGANSLSGQQQGRVYLSFT